MNKVDLSIYLGIIYYNMSSNILQFFVYMYSTYFVKIFTSYFMGFDVIPNDISKSLISNCLLLICKNTIDFYTLTSHHTTMQNSPISSSNFLIDPFGFSINMIDTFTFSFPICKFFFFPALLDCLGYAVKW